MDILETLNRATIARQQREVDCEIQARAGILVELIENSLEQMRCSLFTPEPIDLWIDGRHVGTISHQDGSDGSRLEFTPARDRATATTG